MDLSVLPEDNPSAPMDRKRVLESARRFLRNTVPTISDFPVDVQEVPPMFYPAAFTAWSIDEQ